MKKTICLLLTITMLIGCSLYTQAESNSPILTLEKNQYNSNGERHIKISWEDASSGTYQLQIDEDVNFGSPVNKKRSSRQGKYYNFVLAENVDDTYYIRVCSSNGEWSNVVIADISEPIESENKPYFTIPKIPQIPTIDVSNIQFPTLKIDIGKWLVK